MTDLQERFAECLDEFDNAMLVTERDDELRARPMAIADRTDRGRLWFFTSADSGKLDELDDNPNVAAAMQSERRYLSISGRAKIHRDRARIDDLWSEIQRVWYPEGKDDPRLVLLELEPTYAEYWDTAGLKGLTFAFEAAKAVASGERPEVSDKMHGKIRLGQDRPV